MRLQSLKALLAIAEHGSFSSAALELGVAQSSVSHAIAELEEELGVRLLARSRTGAVPTEVGERVVAHARGIERSLAAIEQEAQVESGELVGVVRVAAFRSLANHVLARTITALRASYPRVTVDFKELSGAWSDTTSPTCDTRLADTGSDLLLTLESVAHDAVFWELMRDEYVAVVPRGWAGSERVGLAELMRHPLIINDGPCSWPMRERLRHLDANWAPEYEIIEDSTMVALAAQGLGVALMPTLTVDAVPDSARILPLDERVERVIGVAVMPRALRVPAVRAFLTVLRELFPGGAVPALDASSRPGTRSLTARVGAAPTSGTGAGTRLLS